MLIGNLTRDPESRTTTTGQTVVNFGLATNHAWKDDAGTKKEKAEFHNIVVWGRLGEICARYLNKGKKIYLEGRLQTRDWQDQSGAKHYKTEIVADNMIMLDRGGAMPANQSEVVVEPVSNTTEEVKSEEIPF